MLSRGEKGAAHEGQPLPAGESGRPSSRGSLRIRLTRSIALLLVAGGAAIVAVVSALLVRSAHNNLDQLEQQIRSALVNEGRLLVESHAQLFQSLVEDNAILDVHNTVARAVREGKDLRYGLFISADSQLWAYSSPLSVPREIEPGRDLGTPAPEVAARALGRTPDELHARSFASREHSAFGGAVIEFAAPVIVRGEYSGTLRYGLSTERMEKALNEVREASRVTLLQTTASIALLVLLAMLLSSVVAARIARRITRPIVELTEAARALAAGKRDVRVSVDRGKEDEVMTLELAFNTMASELEASYEALAEQHRFIQHEVEERRRAEKERTEIESRLIQSQKMEAFGQVAGGVAHDFNNILAVVVGQAELSAMHLDRGFDEKRLREELGTILHAGNQGANLTRQLLTFARREANNPRVVDLSKLICSFEKMLRRVIEENVQIEIDCADSTPRVLVDPGRFEQVLMNLAVNARDAMPRGGKLTISTRRQVLEARRQVATGMLEPGSYAVLEVQDSGTGMTQETMTRMFEPFFTTKEVGVGTGLGLATVHGIVRDAEGFIDVQSELSLGTSFSVWLRSVEAATLSPVQEPSSGSVGRGSARILVCEDEAAVRRLTCTILRESGYNVVEVASAAQALAYIAAGVDPVQMLVTDVVMPGMSGPDLVRIIEPERPDLPVLYVSGYTDDLLGGHGVDGATRRLLRKPFRPVELLRAVSELL